MISKYAFREDVMKKLVVALMLVTLSLVSCGKNNSTNTNPNATAVNPITNTAVSGATQLGSMIDNYTTSFGQSQSSINYYMSWAQLAYNGVNLSYHYTKSTASSSSNNCTLKWGFIYVCSYSNSTSTTSGVTESRKVMNNEVAIATKQNELKGYINNAYAISQNGSTSYLIYLKDGRKVVLDTRYPLQAQPYGIQETSGATEYLYNIAQ